MSVTTVPTGLGSFFTDMTLGERRTFWACAAGWALDGMDFMIYPLVIGTIMKEWNVAAGTAGLAATVTRYYLREPRNGQSEYCTKSKHGQRGQHRR